MGTESYPKGSVSNAGEQKSAKFASANGKVASEINQVGSKTSYPAKGHTGPTSRHKSREQARAPFAKGGGSKLVSATYPGKGHGKLPSEMDDCCLQNPMSGKPKAA
jgi:hypothetical protein